jgi:hydroxymethylbilane synthase
MENATLIVGTRGSKLALVQSEMMAAALRAARPGLAVELKTIITRGDRILDVALSAVGDKGLFVRELELSRLCSTARSTCASIAARTCPRPCPLA